LLTCGTPAQVDNLCYSLRDEARPVSDFF